MPGPSALDRRLFGDGLGSSVRSDFGGGLFVGDFGFRDDFRLGLGSRSSRRGKSFSAAWTVLASPRRRCPPVTA